MRGRQLARANAVIHASTARYGEHAADHWPAAQVRLYLQWLLQHPHLPEERREEIEAMLAALLEETEAEQE